MARPSKYSPELRERAVRMVLDHAADHPSQWAAIRSVGEKLGCSVEALRRWCAKPSAMPASGRG
jgi:transposase-like protein